MMGGVTHNLGQIGIAILVVENVRVVYYFSVLAVSGLVTGVLIGILCSDLLKRARKAIPELREEKK